MGKIAIIFIFIFIQFQLTNAQQFAENSWHSGKILLDTEDTLSGNLKFSLQNDVIQVEMNGSLQTFTSRKVLSFNFYDRFEQRERTYYTLPFTKVSNYKTPTFFELLAQGEAITLLGREALATQTTYNNYYNPYNPNPNFPTTYTFIKTSFYFLYKNGKIKPYDGTKKGLLVLLQDREKDIKEYLKNNKVRFENKEDIINLINYYNQQKAKNDK